MGDPWGRNSTTEENKPNELTSAIDSEQSKQLFDDNFHPPERQESSDLKPNSTYSPLPDSSTYLSNLERKLSKLQKKQTVSSTAEKRDLLLSLSGTREGHVDRFLNSEEIVPREGEVDFFDNPVEESLKGTVIRHLAPHLQAVNTGELIHLLKADQLQETEPRSEEDEEVLEK